MKKALTVAALALSGLAAASPVVPGAETDAAAASYSYDCPSGRVLIGIGGRQGSWMDAAWGICGRIRSNGTINSGDRVTTTRAGGTGGRTGGAVCPSGQVLVGFTGAANSYVNSIRTITCSTWDATNRIANNAVYGHNAFSSRSGFYIQTLCKYGMTASGIQGNAGSYLDTFSVKCAYQPYANPPPAIRTPALRGTSWVVGSCRKDIYGRCM
jgi:hypothetical protein